MVSPLEMYSKFWPSKLDLLGQMEKIGQKMVNGRLLFQALHTHTHAQTETDRHTHTHNNNINIYNYIPTICLSPLSHNENFTTLVNV